MKASLHNARLSPVLSRAQSREYDLLAEKLAKIPSLLLMENAGRGAAEKIIKIIGTQPAKKLKVVILCGVGNNGGDGFVVCRHLARHFAEAIELTVFVAGRGNSLTPDALTNYAILEALCPQALHRLTVLDGLFSEHVGCADIFIDALFGTGLSRHIEGTLRDAIEKINHSAALKFALDIPSGIDADTGASLGCALKVHHTLTFCHPKRGLFTPQGKAHSGEVHTIPLGFWDFFLIERLAPRVHIIDKQWFRQILTPRLPTAYKHRSGNIALFAGGPGKTGAARLAAKAVLRAGAGLVTICSWEESQEAFTLGLDEAMFRPLKRENKYAAGKDAIFAALEAHEVPDYAAGKDAIFAALEAHEVVAIGPGFGLDKDALHAVAAVLENAAKPVVLDADALTLLAQNAPLKTLAQKRKAPLILTPHSGEMARLADKTSAAIESDRYAAVLWAAKEYNAVVVLKGAHTLVCDGHSILVSPWANPALATAGSGDILTGTIAAFAVQADAFDAAAAAVFFHGFAGDIWKKEFMSDRGMLAGDLIENYPKAWKHLQE